MKKVFLGLCLVLSWTALGFGATYYVRPDGGTAEQCTGLVNAPYPGSGTHQPCAWNHPFWAVRNEGGEPVWRLTSGDTLFIASGSYMMGYGAPNDFWCAPEGGYGCVLPPVPSRVRIVGEGWDQGCLHPPELWATERAWHIFDLTGASGVTLACLELTDHASCAYNHSNPEVRCEYDNPPFGPWGYAGLWIQDAENITLRDLNIHGFGSDGVIAGRIHNITLDNVRIAGNGLCGWNGDLWGEPSSNSGDIIFHRVTVEWNGCVETYPGGEPDHCWAQSAGGYGDGLGTAATGGHWVFEDCVFRYNTSDGLDLLYAVVSGDSLIEIKSTMAYGNAGNQIKVGGPVVMENTLAISNCDYFTGKSFAQEMGNWTTGDACRAGGAAISVNMKPEDQSAIINSTIASEGWAQVEVYCGTHDFGDQARPCNGTEVLYLMNDIFLGFPNVTSQGDWPDLVGDGDPESRTRPESIDHNIIYNTQVEEVGLTVGAHNLFADPLLVAEADIDQLDAHLQAQSPAINAGLPVGTSIATWQVPDHDMEGVPRPQGGGVDLGAYEWANERIYTIEVQANATTFTGGDYQTNHLELAFTKPQGLTDPVDLYISLTQPAAEGGSVTFYFQHSGSRVELSNGIYFNSAYPTTDRAPYCSNCTMPDTLQLYGPPSMNPIFNDGWVVPHPFTMADGVESCQYLPDGDYTFTMKAYEPGTNNLVARGEVSITLNRGCQ